LIAPELLVAECANILWKKVQRDELLKQEALLAARLLQGAEIELLPMRSLFETATRMSIEINHPAYGVLAGVAKTCAESAAPAFHIDSLLNGPQRRPRETASFSCSKARSLA
jgi:hypothetical protein